jgi:hypothetical protein
VWWYGTEDREITLEFNLPSGSFSSTVGNEMQEYLVTGRRNVAGNELPV